MASAFERIFSSLDTRAAESVPPPHSTAAQITPPALAMKSELDPENETGG
jgi:hypothetical protein